MGVHFVGSKGAWKISTAGERVPGVDGRGVIVGFLGESAGACGRGRVGVPTRAPPAAENQRRGVVVRKKWQCFDKKLIWGKINPTPDRWSQGPQHEYQQILPTHARHPGRCHQ